MVLAIIFLFLVPDSCRATERNRSNISTNVTDYIIETIRTTLVSAIFRKFGNCFGLFDIAGLTQYRYIVVKYKIHLYSLQNRLEKLDTGEMTS
jgi:hypothetical protein